jgi:hypothetical protein
MELCVVLALASLGVFHGLNPATGWLLAASHGTRRQSPSAVLGALIPLTLGQSVAVGAVLALSAAVALPLQLPVGLLLISLGAYRLFAAQPFETRYPATGIRALAVRSFLAASIQGAGLMAVALAPESTGHAVLAEALGYAAATGIAAWLCLAKLGLGLLRKTQGTVDVLWAAALFASGALVVLG